MIIEFKFNSRSSGQNIPEAITIAKRCGGYIEDKFLCKGVCHHVRYGSLSLQQFFDEKSEYIENNTFSTAEERFIRILTDFLEMDEENHFKFNKGSFLEHFIRETELENKFCKIFSINEAQNQIEKLPDFIKLIPYEESPEYLEQYREEESDIGRWIMTILTQCEISSKLSFEESIKCSKTMALLIGAKFSTTIENTDILIFPLPEINLLIFAKLVFHENFEQLEELDEEEIKFIATKEEDYFCASNPYSKLYFQLFEENDPRLKEHFEKLKEIHGIF